MVTYFYAYINLLFKRIISQDPYAIASTIEHINDYISALNYISSKPLFGYSRSFVIENEIITDGGIFILILRHGIIGLLFFISVIYRKRIWTNITVPCIFASFVKHFQLYYLIIS